MRGEARIQIDAPPERVYELISDVTRMGEWSPECTSCEWLDGASGPAVGARFKGTNRRGWMRWSTRPKVTAADPGKEFSFDTGLTRWSYVLHPQAGGTEVVESFDAYRADNPLGKAFLRITGGKDRHGQLVRNIEKTLQQLKAAAEV